MIDRESIAVFVQVIRHRRLWSSRRSSSLRDVAVLIMGRKVAAAGQEYDDACGEDYDLHVFAPMNPNSRERSLFVDLSRA
jgi:hypothetical protein